MSLFAFDTGRGQPIYLQIAKALETEVRDHCHPGDRLPAEPALAERFSVNRHTVRRAVDELVMQGLVERRHGRGLFVLDGAFDYAIGSQTRFTTSLDSAGQIKETQILRRQILPAQGGVARRLEMAEGAPVAAVETLRLVGGRPFCLINHYLPQPMAGAVFESYEGGSLHQFLAERLDLNLTRTQSLIAAQLPIGDDASLLGIPRHKPVLQVKSINVDSATGRPVEYALTRFRADRVQLSVNP